MNIKPIRSLATHPIGREYLGEVSRYREGPYSLREIDYVHLFSNYYAKWLCPFCKKEYVAIVGNRTKINGTSCPNVNCNSRRSSFLEFGVAAILSSMLDAPIKKSVSTPLWRGEVDIYIPLLGLYIDLSPKWTHDNEVVRSRDTRKGNILRENGITYFQLREYPLEKIHKNDIIVKAGFDDPLPWALSLIPYFQTHSIKYSLLSEKNIKKILQQATIDRYSARAVPQDKSVEYLYPAISKEHFCIEKECPTGGLNNVTKGSATRHLFKCHSCNHLWEATIRNRTKGRDCPQCKGKKDAQKVSLAQLNKGKFSGVIVNNGYIYPQYRQKTLSLCVSSKEAAATAYDLFLDLTDISLPRNRDFHNLNNIQLSSEIEQSVKIRAEEWKNNPWMY